LPSKAAGFTAVVSVWLWASPPVAGSPHHIGLLSGFAHWHLVHLLSLSSALFEKSLGIRVRQNAPFPRRIVVIGSDNVLILLPLIQGNRPVITALLCPGEVW
ncbi:MAG TPA: hypothetical protein VFE77_06755, partial [Rhodanobacter sp.]|nr:hypothetical protein [Rhodanobacter sp.]